MVKDATDRTTHRTADRGFPDILSAEVGAPLVMLVRLDRDFLQHALPELLKRLPPAIFDDLGQGTTPLPTFTAASIPAEPSQSSGPIATP